MTKEIKRWASLNWRGKLNYIFFITNTFLAVAFAFTGESLCFVHIIVAFLCFISYNYAPNCKL